MSIETMLAEQKQWIEQNPLRRWRQQHGITIDQASSLIGVNCRTIQIWEHGSGIPSGRSLLKLQQTLESDQLIGQWMGWMQLKPERT